MDGKKEKIMNRWKDGCMEQIINGQKNGRIEKKSREIHEWMGWNRKFIRWMDDEKKKL